MTMRILGIETSCDETAAAVVHEGREVLSSIRFSQEELHGPYGGVVPELACRRHVYVIQDVIQRAMLEAGTDFTDINAIAVTQGPGLIGALLIGINYAKGLAYQWKKPLIGIHHLEGHILSVELTGHINQSIPFPAIALVVSGGHTNLYRVNTYRDYQLLGRTVDDAAGEAFDKAAKMLGLGYPGGPAIDRLAKEGDPKTIDFPRPDPGKGGHNFSFSGLKTALKYYLNREGDLRPNHRKDIAASYQQAIVDVLVKKSMAAVRKYKASSLIVAGGVAANSGLRSSLATLCDQSEIPLLIPSMPYCTDNGAMIAGAAYYHRNNLKDPSDLLSMSARASLTL